MIINPKITPSLLKYKSVAFALNDIEIPDKLIV